MMRTKMLKKMVEGEFTNEINGWGMLLQFTYN